MHFKRKPSPEFQTQSEVQLRFKKSSLLFLMIVTVTLSFVYTNSIYAETIQKTLPGLNYQRYLEEDNQVIHVLKVDPSQVQIRIKHAKDQVRGRETVENLAVKHKALAAINGGFFHGEPKGGFPAGVLKIANQWYGIAYLTRGALGFAEQFHTANGSHPYSLIDRIQTKTYLSFNNHSFPVHAVNQPPHEKRAVLFTEAYGKETPALVNGLAVVIENNQITSIDASGATAIPKNGFVYVIGAKAKLPKFSLQKTMNTKVNIQILPQFSKRNHTYWQKMENILGGAPVLIENNRLVKDYHNERLPQAFLHKPRARTAIGITEDGKLLLVVVEKNSITRSPGMTIPELARWMQKLGAISALNLDGGGSSTFYFNHAILNHPETELEEGVSLPNPREVSDALLILPKTE